MMNALPSDILNIISNCFIGEKDRISLKSTCRSMYNKIDLNFRWQVTWENEVYSGIGYDSINFHQSFKSKPDHIRLDLLGYSWMRLLRRIEYKVGKTHDFCAIGIRRDGSWKGYIFQVNLFLVDRNTCMAYYEGEDDVEWEDVMNTKKEDLTISCSRPIEEYDD